MECDIAWPSQMITKYYKYKYKFHTLLDGNTNNKVIIFFLCHQMKLGLGTNFVISLGHVPKKADITEICFFSFCKMTSMTFQKSALDLKSLNICRHIDLLPEFKVCILMEVEFLKSVQAPAHNFLAIVEIEITFNHQPGCPLLPPALGKQKK